MYFPTFSVVFKSWDSFSSSTSSPSSPYSTSFVDLVKSNMNIIIKLDIYFPAFSDEYKSWDSSSSSPSTPSSPTSPYSSPFSDRQIYYDYGYNNKIIINNFSPKNYKSVTKILVLLWFLSIILQCGCNTFEIQQFYQIANLMAMISKDIDAN